MRINKRYFLTVFGCLGMTITGCISSNPDRASPQANTGYVDFYTDTNQQLAWEVKRFDERTGELRTEFSKVQPLPGNLLRVPVVPGNHQFRIWFLNRATEGPKSVEVPVENGKVTPVHVSLDRTGTIAVNNEVYGGRRSTRGYGSGQKTVTDEMDRYKINAVSETPQAYQPMERMAYFKPGDLQ